MKHNSQFGIFGHQLRNTFRERLLDVSATAKSIKSALPSFCLGLLFDSSWVLWTRELFFCPFSLFRERLWNCSHSGSGTVGGGGSHSVCSDFDDVTDGDFDGGGVGGGGVFVVFVGVIAVCGEMWNIRMKTGKSKSVRMFLISIHVQK